MFHFYLLIFYASLLANPIEAINQSHEILLPRADECPLTSELLDYCRSVYSACLERKGAPATCSAQFCSCTKSDELRSSEKSCEVYITQSCKHVLGFANKEEENSKVEMILELPPEIMTEVEDVRKNCGFEDSSGPGGISMIKSLHKLLLENRCAQEEKPKLDEALIKLDQQTSEKLFIPYDRFQCGWQTGYIGKVAFRHWMSESCGLYSVNINHCCAEHFNCYMRQMGKETCDQNFVECQTSNVQRMTSFKESCKGLMEQVVQNFPLLNNGSYESVKKADFITKINPSDGHFNQPLDASGTLDLGFLTLSFFQMSHKILVDPEIKKTYNYDILKHGWSNRITIDSCGLLFEDCVQHDKNSPCLMKLWTCLHSIQDRSELFDRAINQLNETIVKASPNQEMVGKIEKMIQDQFNGFEFRFVFEYIALMLVSGIVGFIFEALEIKNLVKSKLPWKHPISSPPTQVSSDDSTGHSLAQVQFPTPGSGRRSENGNGVEIQRLVAAPDGE